MRILFLGPRNPVMNYLHAVEGPMAWAEGSLDEVEYIDSLPDWTVSYGYRHIIKPKFIDQYRGRIINCHISYLPWGRGADPNYWAWQLGEPHGVTIHIMNEGIDTGSILVQELVTMNDHETLRTSYEKLQVALQNLFFQSWEKIKTGQITPIPQPVGWGSYHRHKDMPILPKGWDTPVEEL